MFRLEGVFLSKNGKVLLDNISCHIREGEIFIIFGPSGAGKSTLLRLLNRLTDPTHGKIYFKGKNIREYKPNTLRRTISMVFQIPVMFEGTVEENIKMGAELWNMEVEPEKLMEMVNLDKKLLKENAKNISVGEAQRVAIARALALNPEVLLMDEPTSALDPASTLAIEQLVKSLNRELGITFVFVSHNVEQIKRLNGRGMLLVNGRKIEEGPVNKILSAKGNKEVERFLKGEKV